MSPKSPRTIAKPSAATRSRSVVLSRRCARNILTRAQKLFTKISYVRKFPAGELQDMLSEQVLTTYFPGDTLEKMIVEEAEEGS